MRYRLRTLLVLLTILPPMLAGVWYYTARAALVLAFIGVVAAILPIAIMLWRNGGFERN